MRLSPHSPLSLSSLSPLFPLSPRLSRRRSSLSLTLGVDCLSACPPRTWNRSNWDLGPWPWLGPWLGRRLGLLHGAPILATSSQVPPPGATSHGSVEASANSAPCSQLWFASIAWPAWPAWPALGCLARLGSNHLTSTSQPPWCPSALDVPHSMCEAVCIGMTMLQQTTCLVLSSTWLPPPSTSTSPTAPRLQRLPGLPCHLAPGPRPALAHASRRLLFTAPPKEPPRDHFLNIRVPMHDTSLPRPCHPCVPLS
jgi:hypothetical protein